MYPISTSIASNVIVFKIYFRFDKINFRFRFSGDELLYNHVFITVLYGIVLQSVHCVQLLYISLYGITELNWNILSALSRAFPKWLFAANCRTNHS